MSFADGLLHERQDSDDKTRNKVHKVAERLEELRYYNTEVRVSDSLIEEAIGYLRDYAAGGHLK